MGVCTGQPLFRPPFGRHAAESFAGSLFEPTVIGPVVVARRQPATLAPHAMTPEGAQLSGVIGGRGGRSAGPRPPKIPLADRLALVETLMTDEFEQARDRLEGHSREIFAYLATYPKILGRLRSPHIRITHQELLHFVAHAPQKLWSCSLLQPLASDFQEAFGRTDDLKCILGSMRLVGKISESPGFVEFQRYFQTLEGRLWQPEKSPLLERFGNLIEPEIIHLLTWIDYHLMPTSLNDTTPTEDIRYVLRCLEGWQGARRGRPISKFDQYFELERNVLTRLLQLLTP